MNKRDAIIALDGAVAATIGRLFVTYVQGAASDETGSRVRFAVGISLCNLASKQAKVIIERESWEDHST